jgi:hypothetical protein
VIWFKDVPPSVTSEAKPNLAYSNNIVKILSKGKHSLRKREVTSPREEENRRNKWYMFVFAFEISMMYVCGIGDVMKERGSRDTSE